MRRFRTGTRAVALALAVITAGALCDAAGAAASPTPHAAGWPATPDWQKYVQSP